MRDARHSAQRRAETLVDEGKLLVIRAKAKFAEARLIAGEINEDVPVPDETADLGSLVL